MAVWNLVAVGALWLGIMNVGAFLAFRHDKAQAIAGRRRTRESDLLLLAAMGGTGGAFLARHLYRHKTRKQPFSTWLWLILVVQVGAAIGLAIG
jgi:uncharacterized membrane protein YsdA (DUF1294 family)